MGASATSCIEHRKLGCRVESKLPRADRGGNTGSGRNERRNWELLNVAEVALDGGVGRGRITAFVLSLVILGRGSGKGGSTTYYPSIEHICRTCETSKHVQKSTVLGVGNMKLRHFYQLMKIDEDQTTQGTVDKGRRRDCENSTDLSIMHHVPPRSLAKYSLTSLVPTVPLLEERGLPKTIRVQRR